MGTYMGGGIQEGFLEEGVFKQRSGSRIGSKQVIEGVCIQAEGTAVVKNQR